MYLNSFYCNVTHLEPNIYINDHTDCRNGKFSGQLRCVLLFSSIYDDLGVDYTNFQWISKSDKKHTTCKVRQSHKIFF